MIDPILSLAFAMHSNKGAYALLLGSGVSRSAGIPTGWEVVLDLVRKLAAMKREDCEPDPAKWYRNSFGDEPEYDRLLNVVAKLPAERSQLLRLYFEPTDEEREQSLKVPTEAHKAISRLVSNGYIRAIITTNFDRLLEKALETLSIIPTVISTPDAVEGALPLIHTSCTIIKIHGDYLDTRIKNTPGELSRYDKRMVRLLDRIFDEFGLIVCGWSADWDDALRAALEHCKTQRFGTFWTVRGKPSDAAERLIKHRRADTIQIQDANAFFRELEEKVTALNEVSKPHPLSAKVAVASLKRYIVEDRYRIALHDLITNETERVYTEMQGGNFSLTERPINTQTVSKRIQSYDALIEILLSLFATGCHWGDRGHDYLWIKCLDRLINLPVGINTIDKWNIMQRYPALCLLYAGGIASLVTSNYQVVTALLTKVNTRTYEGEKPLVFSLYPNRVADKEVWELLPGMERRYTPGSDHLYMRLREPLREFLPRDDIYDSTFDRFEYLFALVHGDLLQKQGRDIWGPPGRFVWKHHSRTEKSILSEIEGELDKEGGNWAPLKAGLFDGAKGRIREVKQGIDEMVNKIPWN